MRPWEVSLLVSVAYPGKEKDYAAKERVTIRGPLTPLFSHKDLFENGLVEQAVEFVRRNTGVTARLADGARREEIWTYPEEAVREAIVNALVHRDYLLSGTDIELSIYEDRLEVISGREIQFACPFPFIFLNQVYYLRIAYPGINPGRFSIGCFLKKAERN